MAPASSSFASWNGHGADQTADPGATQPLVGVFREASALRYDSPGGAAAISQGREPLVGRQAYHGAPEGRKKPPGAGRGIYGLSPLRGSLIRSYCYQGLTPLAN